MKISKKQLKALIREQVAAVLDETEWRDVYDQEKYFSPQSKNVDTTEASMTPNKEVEGEIALSDAVDILSSLGYSQEDLMDLVRDLIPRASGDHPSWEDDASHPDSPDYEEEETVKIGTPEHDPMDRSALGKYRKGKMTNFTEEKEDDSFSDAGEEIKKDKTTGVFTKKAKKRGMSAQEFARKVLANTDEYDLKTVRQASFAKGADTVAKKRKKK